MWYYRFCNATNATGTGFVAESDRMKNWKLSISGAGHLRRRVMTGEVSEFIYKEGSEEKMRRGPRVGTVVPLWLDSVERECLERMGYGEEFLVRIEEVRVVRGLDGVYRMWLKVSPVNGYVGCDLDGFSRWRYLG